MKQASRLGSVFADGRWVQSLVSAKGRPLGTPKKPELDGKRYAKRFGKKLSHIRAEKALGRPLRGTELVHHVDPSDKYGSTGPLVICPDQAYHALIEVRGRALRESGNANYRKCRNCLKWDDPENMRVFPDTRPGHFRHLHEKVGGRCVDKGTAPATFGGAGRWPAKARTEGIWEAVGDYKARCLICAKELNSAVLALTRHARGHVAEGTATARKVPGVTVKSRQRWLYELADSVTVVRRQAPGDSR